jgi:hypothetical protein
MQSVVASEEPPNLRIFIARTNVPANVTRIELARLIDGPAREAKKIYDAQDEIKK